MADLRRTDDGSYTLYDSTSDECYHSYKGALTESEYVFLAAGGMDHKLRQAKANKHALTVVEMGLGTGLNYLLSARAAKALGVELQYHALENNLLDKSTLKSLQYADIPGMAALSREYLQLPFHAQILSQGVHRFDTSGGALHLHYGDAIECELPADHFRLCFYDAFSPSGAPALWHQSQLKKFYNCLLPGGNWVSYCARGAVRRDLLACGFLVERLPGPPGKREMLLATRPHTEQPLPTL